MTYWLFGWHGSGVTGDYTGIGEYRNRLKAVGKPRIFFSVDHAGIVYEMAKDNLARDILGFRMTEKNGENLDRLQVDQTTGRYIGNPYQLAHDRFERVTYHFPPELIPYRGKIWETWLNEPSPHHDDMDFLGLWALTCAEIALANNIRYAAWGFGGGSPEPEFWHNKHVVEYLKLCEDYPDQLGINLHLYSFNNADLLANYDYQVGRYIQLHDACDSLGVARPFIFAAETGWGEDAMKASRDEVMAQLQWVQHDMAASSFRGGCTLWTKGGWHGSIVADMLTIDTALTDAAVNYDYVEVPPMDKPKIVIVKKPQKDNMTEAENERVSKWAWENYGRTTTHSTDDMLTMLAGGNDESYAVLWWAERQPGAEAALLDAGNNYIMMPDDPKPPPAFSFSHYPCQGVTKKINQAFGANPQNYEQFGLPGHEGIDFYAPHGTPILAVADGQVYRVESTDNSNYGLQVRVNHGDGHKTVYAHLNNVDVTVGQFVTGGQKLGNADNTGNSFGSHLHLTYKREGLTYTDAKGNVWPSNIFDPTPLIAPFMPTQPPPTGRTIDMLQYFAPATGSYGPITIKDTSWNGQVRQQIQAHGDYLYVTKGNEFEARQLLNNRIFFIMDDSPGDGKYYTVESADGWIPRYFTEGQSFTRKETARFYYKNNCNATGEVNNWTNVIKFVKFYQTWTAPSGIVFNDVSHLQWVLNGVVEEDYYFAPHCGYALWKNKHGRQSHIVSMPRGQGNNVFSGACYWPAFGKEWT